MAVDWEGVDSEGAAVAEAAAVVARVAEEMAVADGAADKEVEVMVAVEREGGKAAEGTVEGMAVERG